MPVVSEGHENLQQEELKPVSQRKMTPYQLSVLATAPTREDFSDEEEYEEAAFGFLTRTAHIMRLRLLD